MQRDFGQRIDKHRNKQARGAIKERGQDDFFESSKGFARKILRRQSILKVSYRRGDKKIPRNHKEDLVGPAAQQVNGTKNARIGECGERRVFRHAGVNGFECPLKRVEDRDASDRYQAQRFDGYVACGFGLHGFLS